MSTKDFLEKQMLVLNEIASLVEKQKGNGPISLTYLLENTALEEEEVKEIVYLLEKEGDIEITHPTQRVSLIQPLPAGYKKIATWEEKKKAQKPNKKLLSVGKIIGGSLLAALLGLLWWWLGLSPSTTEIVPLSASVPIRIYHMGMSPPNSYMPGGWYYFPNAPEEGEILSAVDHEATNELYRALSIEFIPVTFDGLVQITLDVESIVPSYQVNIDRVQIAVTRKSVKNPENIFYEPPHLGAGDIREYEITLSPDTQLSQDNGIEYYEAILEMDDQKADYIYLSPQERETIRVSIQLDNPGIFELTPIVHYSYRDEKATVNAENYTVVYPKEYRAWMLDVEPSSCSGGVCTGGGSTLIFNGVILNTQTDIMTFDNPATFPTSVDCLPDTKWIAFEASFVTFGYYRRLFLIDTNGNNLNMISDDYHGADRYLAWLHNGSLAHIERYWDNVEQKYVDENFLIDPFSLETKLLDEINHSEIFYDNLIEGQLPSYGTQSQSVDGQWLLLGGEKLSMMRADGSCAQDIFIPPSGDITNILLQP